MRSNFDPADQNNEGTVANLRQQAKFKEGLMNLRKLEII